MSDAGHNLNPATEAVTPLAALTAGAVAGATAGAAGPLRIVLFGLPGAGKSALLAALAQVQHAHPSLLSGQLTDDSGGLARQRQLFYDELSRPTEEETVDYPLRFRPAGRGTPFQATLIDSDGRVVEEMLGQPLSADADSPAGTLPNAVLDADALVLVIDAATPPQQADEVFADFADFLRRLEMERGAFTEVTGLPVYVVLTKCDLLARPRDSTADWMGHIEERKRQLGGRLRELLDEGGQGRPQAFGRLDLHLWATAARRPALGTFPARPREPYGVAELFRQCLAQAQTFRGRRRRAGRRLAWATSATAALATGLMALVLVLLTGFGQHQPGDLERDIERYRLQEGPSVANRLLGWLPEMERRQRELKAFQRDPDFPHLPRELRDFVAERRREMNEYVDFLRRVVEKQFPSIAHNDRELEKRKAELEKDLPLPHEDWDATGAGTLRQQRLDDLRLLAERARSAEEFFQKKRLEGVKLWTFRQPPRAGGRINWRGWQDAVTEYLQTAADLPPAVEDLPPQSLVTPNVILQFDRVHRARNLVLASISDLKALRNISTALGLAEPTPLRPALLVIPRPPGFPPPVARARYQRLAGQPTLPASLAGLLVSPGVLRAATTFYPGHLLVPPYPAYREEFALARVPDAARAEVKLSASNYFSDLLVPLREQILDKYQQVSRGANETPAFWRSVGDWLALNPPPLTAYRGLGLILDRLRRRQALDPVTALAAFLRSDQFAFSLRGASLLVPYDADVSVPDNAVLTITHGQRVLTLPLEVKETKRDPQARTTTYFFKAALQTVTYRPGEAFEMSLPLREGRVLTWLDKRTRTYAFECLSRPPRLHDKGQRPQLGTRADDIVLTFDTPVPDVPDALPALGD